MQYVMLGLIACVSLAVLSAMLPLPAAPVLGKAGSFVIRRINIVDVVAGRVIEDATLIIEHGRIVSIRPDLDSSVPVGHTVVEGAGLYLLPGLWDMHTHSLKTSPQLHHPLFVRHGVTSVRDMSGCLEEEDSYWACPQDRREWQESSLEGESISPRYPLQSSYQTNGGNEVPAGYSDFFRLNSITDAESLVEFYSGEGVDFIKTYSELSQKQFSDVATATRNSGLHLAGHKPLVVPLLNALEAGMSSIEHGRLFMFECYKDINAFREEGDPLSLYTAQKIRDIVNHQDEQKCGELMRAMASTETHWVPTLSTLKMSAMARDGAFREDARLRAIPMVVRRLLWQPDINRAAETGFDSQNEFVHGDYFEMAKKQVAAANEAGVKILAGTDNIDTYVFTGSGLHDELANLVDAGLTPLEALQAATINAAEFAGRDHDLGSIEEGKIADLVFVKENPLSKIGSTRAISGVMFNGIFFDEAALSTLEQYSINMARSVRVNLSYLAGLLMSPLMRVQLAD